jgi:pyruvate dehydrogenase E1 component beta subunit
MSSPDPQPARRLTIARAMSEALAQEMDRDPSVLVMGEDIGKLGGVFGTTQGLLDRFGPERVRDTPISETAFIGAAVGMAASGLRPVVELMFVDFFGVCMDAIYNLAAKQCYFSGGQVSCPMVLMSSVGGGYGDAGAFAVPLRHLRPSAGPQGRDPLQRRRRQGPDALGDPR